MNNSTFSVKYKRTIIKIFITVIIYSAWIIFRFVFDKDDKGFINNLYCFQDNLMINVFTEITNYLTQHLQVRDFMLIFASNILDILVIFAALNYICYGNSSKFFIAFGGFLFFPLPNIPHLLSIKFDIKGARL